MTSITFFLVFIPLLTIILLAVNLILATHNPYQEKDSVFECGFHSFLGQNRTQFNISFFIFALLFLLFDLEILLAYPYVVSAYINEVYGLIIILVFFLILTLGFAYELGKNALEIDSKQMFIKKKNNDTVKLIMLFYVLAKGNKIKYYIFRIKYSIFNIKWYIYNFIYDYHTTIFLVILSIIYIITLFYNIFYINIVLFTSLIICFIIYFLMAIFFYTCPRKYINKYYDSFLCIRDLIILFSIVIFIIVNCPDLFFVPLHAAGPDHNFISEYNPHPIVINSPNISSNLNVPYNNLNHDPNSPGVDYKIGRYGWGSTKGYLGVVLNHDDQVHAQSQTKNIIWNNDPNLLDPINFRIEGVARVIEPRPPLPENTNTLGYPIDENGQRMFHKTYYVDSTPARATKIPNGKMYESVSSSFPKYESNILRELNKRAFVFKSK
jgi:NADH-ubiquinone oxidoreductase chain 3